MKMFVPLLSLLLIGGTAQAQEKKEHKNKKEKYHVAWVDQHGQPKCHNAASKEQAEKNAAHMRLKKDVTGVTVAEGFCDRKEDKGETKPHEGTKPSKPRGEKPEGSHMENGGQNAPAKPNGEPAKPVREKPQGTHMENGDQTAPAKPNAERPKPTVAKPQQMDTLAKPTKPMREKPNDAVLTKPSSDAENQRPAVAKPTQVDTVAKPVKPAQEKPATLERAKGKGGKKK